MKIVMITGASSGIGLDSTVMYASRGYTVYCLVQTEDEVRLLSEREGLKPYACDLSNLEAVSDVVTLIADDLRNKDLAIDILFHNAGYAQPGSIADLPTDALVHQFMVNFFAIHEITRITLPLMNTVDAKIIVNSSILGRMAMPLRAAYVSSKFALEGWVDTLRLEVSSHVSVCLIEAGPVETNFRKNSLLALKKNITSLNPSLRNKYLSMEKRLSTSKNKSPFVLSSATVAARIVKISETNGSIPHRKLMTLPAYIFAFLKAVFPSRLLDKILQNGT